MGGLTGVTDGIKDLAAFVGRSAPALAGVLVSPFASVGLSLLGGMFGVSPADVAKLVDAVKGDPESSSKLKQVEYDHAQALERLQNERYATEVEDRKDARSHGIEYKEFLKKMAIMVTFGFFASLFALFLPIDVSDASKNLLSMLVGMLASKWQTIIDFFYGSSRHNREGATK